MNKKITLREKMEKINFPEVPELKCGSAKTIEEFWEKFIEPMLPEKKTVL